MISQNGFRVCNLRKNIHYNHQILHRGKFYCSTLNYLCSSLLSINIKIKIHNTLILPFVLYGCETLTLALREERKLRVFENRLLREIFGPKRVEVTGGGGKYIMRTLMICNAHQKLFV